MISFVDLGWTIGKLTKHDKNGSYLHIITPSDNSEGFHEPAESVKIYGDSNILALRDALNKQFPDETKTEDFEIVRLRNIIFKCKELAEQIDAGQAIGDYLTKKGF